MTYHVGFIIGVFLSVKVSSDVSHAGYSYPQPQPPLEDASPPPNLPPSPPPSVYLPVYPPVFSEDPQDLYPPPLDPPIFEDEDTVAIAPSPFPPTSLYQTPVAKMRILNMSCVMNSSFKSTIRIEGRSSQDPPPVIEDDNVGCISPATTSNFFRIDVDGSKKMASCGVKRCSPRAGQRDNMCVVVRMPVVKGLKLPEDGLVTLQCIPQDSVVTHTKHLRLGPTSFARARSNSGIVASGGGQKGFNSHIVLLRKSPNSGNFDQPLLSGSVVPLGEEIILRATVQDGDGWRYSRMGPVTIRSTNSQKSISLVEENGCRSPGMKAICPHQPRQLSPLDNVLHFRAFLFQESSRGDDMVMSVKMVGCINPQDCFQNGICDRTNLTPPLRFRREVESANETSWESHIKFKVRPSQDGDALTETNNPYFGGSFLFVAMLVTCIFLIVVLFTLYCKK